MKKSIIKLTALILLAILPLPIFTAAVEALPDQYSNTYVAAFPDKYEKLYSTDGKKIVFIGGSSLPFGLRSDLIQAELGDEYTVINFGLYATLGTKFMMDTAKDSIGEGDIIILCPELNTQTYSLYFNPTAVLEACDGYSPILKNLEFDNKLSLFYNYYKFAFAKIGYYNKNAAPDPEGIYRSDSFNEYGDLCVERKNNVMNNGWDSNMTVHTDDSLLDTEFIEYVNEYVAFARRRGAEVYFNYSPTNCMAIRTSSGARAAFQEKLRAALDCPILGDIEDYLIDERYFYDTNFHLNSAGAVYFSRMLSISLKDILGMETPVSIQIPDPPPLAADEAVTVDPSQGNVAFEDYSGEPNNDYLDFFIYELNGSSYTIVGVKAEYMGMTEVILPSVYEGKNISAIAANAFAGCTDLERIHIGNTYKSLAEKAFSGCISLEGIYFYVTDGNMIAPPPSGLLDGTPASVKIYIPEGANFSTGYTWSNYSERFEYFN